MGNSSNRSRRGVTLVEAALAMALIGIVMAGMFSLINDQSERRRAQNTADHLEIIAEASRNYMRMNAHALRLATVESPTQARILVVPIGRRNDGESFPAGPSGTTLPSVQGGGFLPASFIDTNAYDQHHFLLLRQTYDGTTPTGRIEGMVVANGGRKIDDRHLGQIAMSIGATGGFVPDRPISGGADRISGSAGGWGSFISEWQANGVRPAAGYPVVAMALNEDSIVSDFVSRRDVGNPEANRMRTNLSMGEGTDVNSITDIASLETTANGAKSIDFVENSFLTLRNGPNTRMTIRNDGRVDITGNLTVGNDLTVANDITGSRNVSAAGNLTAVQDVSAGQDIVGNQNLTVGTGATGTGEVRARRLRDRDNATFVAEPGGSSRLNSVKTNYFDLDTLLVNGAGTARPYGTKNDETLGGAVSRLWGCRLEYRFMFSGPTGAALGRPIGPYPEGPWVQGPLMDGSSNTGAMSRQYAQKLDNECNHSGCAVQMRMNCPDGAFGSTPPGSPTPPDDLDPPDSCPVVTGATLVANTPPHCLYEPTAGACPANMTQHASSTPSRRICVLTVTQVVEVPGPTPPPRSVVVSGSGRVTCETGRLTSCSARMEPGWFDNAPRRPVISGNTCIGQTYFDDGPPTGLNWYSMYAIATATCEG